MGRGNQQPAGTKTQCSSQRRIPSFNLTADQTARPDQPPAETKSRSLSRTFPVGQTLRIDQQRSVRTERPLFRLRGGEDKSWLQMAETYPAVSSKRCSPLYNQDFSFSIFNALSKISCLSFLPFSSLPHHPNENVKKKINFDLIGFHFSLQGNKN